MTQEEKKPEQKKPENAWDVHKHYFKNGQIEVGMFDLQKLCTGESQELRIEGEEIAGLTLGQGSIRIDFKECCYIEFPLVVFRQIPIDMRGGR